MRSARRRRSELAAKQLDLAAGSAEFLILEAASLLCGSRKFVRI